MSRIERFEDIEAWKMGRELTKLVYRVSTRGSFARDFGLKDQIQRASGSIMHNIAEGFDGETNPEFIRFLGYAKRSCTEVQSQLHVAIDQQFISEEEFTELYTLARNTRGKIKAFMNYLKNYEQQKNS